jgi:hypothetical protein
LVGIASVISVAVSYLFFQKELYGPVRTAIFSLGDVTDGVGSRVVAEFRRILSKALFNLSELLNGPPGLEGWPGLRLSLPILAVLVVGVLMFGIPRFQRPAKPQ